MAMPQIRNCVCCQRSAPASLKRRPHPRPSTRSCAARGSPGAASQVLQPDRHRAGPGAELRGQDRPRHGDQAAHAGALAARAGVHLLLRVLHPLRASAGVGRGAVDDLAGLRRPDHGLGRASGGGDPHEITEKYKGNYILAVEGNPPLNQEGMSCIIGGRPFVEQLQGGGQGLQGDHLLGQLRLLGLRAGGATEPDPATPVHKVIRTSRSSRCRAARPSPRS
jgi:hypothetical protein